MVNCLIIGDNEAAKNLLVNKAPNNFKVASVPTEMSAAQRESIARDYNSYFREADVSLLVFDLHNPQPFLSHIPFTVGAMRLQHPSQKPLILVGVDLTDNPLVHDKDRYDSGLDTARSIGAAGYYECSERTGIERVFIEASIAVEKDQREAAEEQRHSHPLRSIGRGVRRLFQRRRNEEVFERFFEPSIFSFDEANRSARHAARNAYVEEGPLGQERPSLADLLEEDRRGRESLERELRREEAERAAAYGYSEEEEYPYREEDRPGLAEEIAQDLEMFQLLEGEGEYEGAEYGEEERAPAENSSILVKLADINSMKSKLLSDVGILALHPRKMRKLLTHVCVKETLSEDDIKTIIQNAFQDRTLLEEDRAPLTQNLFRINRHANAPIAEYSEEAVRELVRHAATEQAMAVIFPLLNDGASERTHISTNSALHAPINLDRILLSTGYDRFDFETICTVIQISEFEALHKYPHKVGELLDHICITDANERLETKEIIDKAFPDGSLSQEDRGHLQEDLEYVISLFDQPAANFNFRSGNSYSHEAMMVMIRDAAIQTALETIDPRLISRDDTLPATRTRGEPVAVLEPSAPMLEVEEADPCKIPRKREERIKLLDELLTTMTIEGQLTQEDLHSLFFQAFQLVAASASAPEAAPNSHVARLGREERGAQDRGWGLGGG